MFLDLFRTQLQVLQLEGYHFPRFLRWWQYNLFRRKLKNKIGLKYTSKVKLLNILSLVIIVSETIYIIKFPALLLFILLIHLSFPFTLLGISLIIAMPYEIIRKKLTISHTRTTILSSKNLTTIGITGSYGKTTTKNYLHSILSLHQETVVTPESYNTTFGIAKCVDLEICNKSRYFICEMDAYQRGEIRELCFQVPPKYALLISVGPQHLERLGSLEDATIANFELIDSVNPQNALVSIDNPFIAKRLKSEQYKYVKTFSLSKPEADFFLTNFKMNSRGITMTIHSSIDQRNYQFAAPVFGSSNLVNLTASVSMALMLKIPIKHISQGLKSVSSSPHRLQLVTINKSTIIDDSYSSNVEGFENIIRDLSMQKGKKAIITPGVVELGQLTRDFHEKIGKKISQVFDIAYLVGKSDRTDNINRGINDNIKVVFTENNINVWDLCKELSNSYSWILIENDLPENY